MNSTTLSFQHKAKDILKKYPNFKEVEKGDEEVIHHLYETVDMELLKGLSLCYSRKPNLKKSFSESRHHPFFVFDAVDNSFMASINECQQIIDGKQQNSFYSSDLRIAPRASIKTRRKFRDCYAEMIALMEEQEFCSTAILKDNIKALRALTSGKYSIFYNKMFEYLSRTFVILPTLNFFRTKTKGMSIVPLQEWKKDSSALDQFLKDKVNQYQFSNDFIKFRTTPNLMEFVLLNDQQEVKGYFSLFRPASKSLLVKAKSRWHRLLLNFLSLILRKDIRHKLPWIYLSSWIIDSDIQDEEEVFKELLKKLYQKKVISTGDLLLTLEPENQKRIFHDGNFFMGLPQILNKVLMFKVSSKEENAEVKGKVHLNPAEL